MQDNGGWLQNDETKARSHKIRENRQLRLLSWMILDDVRLKVQTNRKRYKFNDFNAIRCRPNIVD